MITWAEVSTLLRTLWRWSWVILIAVALSGGTAFLASRYERRYYIARASLMIGNSFESARPDQNAAQLNAALGNFYAELARRERILKPVQESLGLTFSWQLISDEMLRTNVLSTASLLELYVTDTNPDRAAAIANAIAEQLIAYSPTSPDKVQAEQAAIESQLVQSAAQIQELRQRIDDATLQQQQATSASDLTEINATITQLQNSLSKEQDKYNSLLIMKSTSVINSLSVFEAAVPPAVPLPSKRILMIAIAAVIGLLVSSLAVFFLDRLDSRWRSARDAEQRFNLRLLGNLPKGPPIIASLPPLSVTRHEAVRAVQSNLLLAAGERGLRTLLITSPRPSLDRTALSIDLANLFARSGLRVLLVDADPIQSDLTRSLHAFESAHSWSGIDHQNNRIWTHLVPTPITNVALLPANNGTTGEPSMLSSPRWQELSNALAQLVDIVIFDGPSVLVGPDAALLAPHLDGTVLMLDSHTDDRSAVLGSKTRLLHQPGVRLLGAVVTTPGQHDGSPWRLPDHRNPELPEVQPTDLVKTTDDVTSVERVTQDELDDEVRVIITPASDTQEDHVAAREQRLRGAHRSPRNRRSGYRQRDNQNR
jgi:succinoglycan biosynthesis transport protein ExoP